MAWAQVANIKGDPGEAGAAGPAPQLRVDGGWVQWRPEGGEWANLITVEALTGPAGADGTGVSILGSYESEGDLTTAHPTGDPGDAYLVDGDLYVWSADGEEWVNVGNIQGPPGAAGADGADGDDGATGDTGPRGATWFTGAGTPGAISGQAVGDLYLDTQTGTVYVLGA